MLDPGFGFELFSHVLGHDQQVFWLSIQPPDRQPLAVGGPNAVARGFDLVPLQRTAVFGGQLIAVACEDAIGGRRRKDVMICLADHLVAAKTQKLFGGAIDQHKAKFNRVLYRDGYRDVFNDDAQELARTAKTSRYPSR